MSGIVPLHGEPVTTSNGQVSPRGSEQSRCTGAAGVIAVAPTVGIDSPTADETLNLIDWIRKQFADLPDVNEMYLFRETLPSHQNEASAVTILRVWTVLKEASEEARRRVYEREAAICRTFPRFEFDFYTTDRPEEPRASGFYRILPAR